MNRYDAAQVRILTGRSRAGFLARFHLCHKALRNCSTVPQALDNVSLVGMVPSTFPLGKHHGGLLI
jgi:hypothetical protein